jgi:acyl-CoA thioester hydrolase
LLTTDSKPHIHRVQIYYEDTDFSGLVYHANYLRYFERAREHLIGVAELVRLWNEEDVGFVVYKAEMTFKQGARHGDTLEIRTTVHAESPYRAIFQQNVWRPEGEAPMVVGSVQLTCTNREGKLVKLPASVYGLLAAHGS